MKKNIKAADFSYTIYAASDQGLERDHNEDYHLYCSDIARRQWHFFEETSVDKPPVSGSLLMLADGMGGLNAGEIASSVACEAIKEYFSKNYSDEIITDEKSINEFLISSIASAQEALENHQQLHPESEGMGTTMVLAWVLGRDVHISWVGDSRCYLYLRDNTLHVMSKDHSLVQSLVDEGKITEEQAFYHPQSNIITQSLGSSERRPRPDVNKFSVNPGDRLMLCSDGLNGMIQDKEIKQIIDNNPETKNCVSALINEAKKAGGEDNITVILCDFEGEGFISNKIKSRSKLKPAKTKKKKIFIGLVLFIAIACAAFFGFKCCCYHGSPDSKSDSIAKAKKIRDDSINKVQELKKAKPGNDSVNEHNQVKIPTKLVNTPKPVSKPDNNEKPTVVNKPKSGDSVNKSNPTPIP